jgi:SAM-dependent methyltransferase
VEVRARQEGYRREYARRRPGWRDSLQVYRGLVRGQVPPQGRVLDVGCGHAGWLIPDLDAACMVAGLDPDLRALRRNTSHRDRVMGVAERLPFEDRSFDLVASAWVFEHLEDPEETARELARVLRPGGHLVFLTPNSWNYNAWLIRAVPDRLHDSLSRRLYGREEFDTYRVRYRLNSARRLESVLTAAGFRRCQLLLNGDPTYLAFNRPLFALGRAIERALDAGPLQRARVHLLGVYEKA